MLHFPGTNHIRGLGGRLKTQRLDFVVETPLKTWAVEVKSTSKSKINGLKKFCSLYPEAHPFIIGTGKRKQAMLK